MPEASAYRPPTYYPPTYCPIFWFSCCVLFIYFALSLTALGTEMFGDTDPLWHLATGDLIRKLHALPEHDPWSFTAGDYPWFNIAWLWDVAFSTIHEQFGWHGTIAINAIIVSLIITTTYITCVARGCDFVASIITTICTITLLSLFLRPLQLTSLMVALWMLVLGSVMRRQIKTCWLFALPLTMLLWVNIHGGFLVGPVLLSAYFLQAWRDKQRDLAIALFVAGIAAALAILCNPYGIHIIEGTLRTMTSAAKVFIGEWKSFIASPDNLISHVYLLSFCLLIPRRPLPVFAAERWLAYIWLVMALIANRNLSLFAIISAPVLAAALSQWFSPAKTPPFLSKMTEALLHVYNRPTAALAALALAAGIMIWLPTPWAARIYDQENVSTANLNPEIAFIKASYPKARLLTHFDLGGILLYQTKGEIPVFVDPRCETAYPTEVVGNFVRFLNAEPGWEAMIKHYRLDGVMLPNEGYDSLMDRFVQRREWKQVFKGPRATIFMYAPPKP